MSNQPEHNAPAVFDRLSSGDADLPRDVETAAPSPSSLDEKRETRQITGFRWFTTVTSLYITCFLYGLDTTIVAAVQADVVRSFGHVEQLAWIGSGFPLGSVTVIFLMGYLYNTFNMKWMFVITVTLFDIGSALCGAAPNMTALIVGRVIAGAGGTGIYLGSLNYVTAMTAPEERGLYATLVGFFWGLGSVLGPVVGGAFAVSSATWRWAFYLNLVIGAASAPAYLICLPSIRLSQTGLSIKDRLLAIDYAGFILGAGVWTSFLLSFTMAGGQWPWKDGRTIATFIVFGITVVLYGLQQRFSWFTSSRAFPVHLLKERTQVLLYVSQSALTTSLFVSIFYIPLFFTFVKNDSALTAALRLLPYVVVAVVTSVVSGHYVARVRYMLLFVGSAIILILGGSLLVVYLTPNTSNSLLYGFTVIIAFGTGLALQKAYAVAPLKTDLDNANMALSLQNVAEIGGQVIALAISGQIYHSTAVSNLMSALAGQGFSQSEIIGALSGAQSTLFSKLDGPLRDAAVAAIAKSLQTTFILVPVSGGVMLLAGLLMRWEKLM
ncbi:MFS general substrate transporter [Xylariaceae sp. FL1019]|nr:MFS general substrate transporter [Xylariaceae sp. FL1019]